MPDELTQALEQLAAREQLADQALADQLEQYLAVLPPAEADQIRAEIAAAEAAEQERVLAEERAIAAQALTPAERERQEQLMPLPSEGKADCAEWRDRMIALDGEMIVTAPSRRLGDDEVSIDLARVRRRDRERLMRIPLNRPGRLRRGILALQCPPVCHGARLRTGARPRGRRERRTSRSSRGPPSGSSEPGGDGEPHGRPAEDEVGARRRLA